MVFSDFQPLKFCDFWQYFWHYSHRRVSVVVADGLVPIRASYFCEYLLENWLGYNMTQVYPSHGNSLACPCIHPLQRRQPTSHQFKKKYIYASITHVFSFIHFFTGRIDDMVYHCFINKSTLVANLNGPLVVVVVANDEFSCLINKMFPKSRRVVGTYWQIYFFFFLLVLFADGSTPLGVCVKSLKDLVLVVMYHEYTVFKCAAENWQEW